MAQIFSPHANQVVYAVLYGVLVVVFMVPMVWVTIDHSPWRSGQFIAQAQPVPFSHAHHVGEVGLTCEYCHGAVRTSASAGMPSTEVCMTCHSQILADAPVLAPIRASFASGTPIVWNRVNQLPDYVYFNHAAHVNNGVGCVTCHGRVDEMPLMSQAAPLTMEWCLNCHRDPGPKSPARDRRVFDGLAACRGPAQPRHRAAGPLPHSPRSADGLLCLPPIRPCAKPWPTDSPARFWRSLDELSGTPSFRVQLAREFPDIAARFGAATNRRTALKLLGASLLMAGVAACKAPDGIAPYVTQPEYVVPGKARYFATSVPIDGYAMGVLAESHDGRPTKVEGNPLHPASLGGTDAIMQASVWSLYDPSRSRDVRHGPEISTWSEFQSEMAALRAMHLPSGGRGIGVVIGTETSPTLARQLAALKQAMPELRVYRHAPLSPLAETVEVFDLSKAQTLVSLDGDFLGEGPGKLAYARAFADGRRVRRADRTMSRLYAIETLLTLTGANADWKRRGETRRTRRRCRTHDGSNR